MKSQEAWAILQIEPTTDLREIKRAYAARLKADRTHSDTARFIALREAYELALFLAETEPVENRRSGDAALPDDAPGTTATGMPAEVPGGAEAARTTAMPWQMPAAQPLQWEVGDALRLPRTPREMAPALAAPALQEPPPQPALEADEIVRQPRLRGDTPAPPAGPERALPALFAELSGELAALQAPQALGGIISRLVASLATCSFAQREQAECRLVELLARHRIREAACLDPLVREFGWHEDTLGLQQRFPLEAEALLEWLRPAPTVAHTAPAHEIPAEQRGQLVAILRGSYLKWLRVTLFGARVRPALEQLLASGDRLPEVSPERKALWHASLTLLPALGGHFYGWTAFYGFLVFAKLSPVAGGFPIALLTALLLPFGLWVTILLPWHHSRAENSPYARHWPLAALLIVLLPGLWQACTGVMASLALVPTIIVIRLFLMLGSLLFGLSMAAFFRYRTRLTQALATPLWGRMLPMTLCLGGVALLYTLPGTGASAASARVTLGALLVMLVFSFLRLWKWLNPLSGLFVVPLLLVCGGTLAAILGESATDITRMCLLAINFVWVAESAMAAVRQQPVPSLCMKAWCFAFTLLGFALMFLPASDAYRCALGLTTLLGAEYAIPLLSMRWNALKPVGMDVMRFVAVELFVLFMLGGVLGGFLHTNGSASLALGVMLGSRLLWTILTLRSPLRTQP